MTFTYPLDFPSGLSLNDLSVELFSASTESMSPFDLTKEFHDLNAERWEIKGSFQPMTREQSDIYSTFLMKLKGSIGTFLMTIPDSKNPRGSWLGTPVVDGADQTGNTLNLTGFTPDSSNVAVVGDWISIGLHLYRVVETADSDENGDVTLTIVPRLRESPPDATAVTFNEAKGHFRLTNKRSGYSASASGGSVPYSLKLECEEVLI